MVTPVCLDCVRGCFPPELVSTLSCIAPPRFPFSDVDAAAELTPALLVLNKLVLASEDSRVAVKRVIFPPEADEVCACVRARENECFCVFGPFAEPPLNGMLTSSIFITAVFKAVGFHCKHDF